MDIPNDRLYSAQDIWVQKVDDNTFTLGITDYAQYSLGEIVWFDLPTVGDVLDGGDEFGVVESTKTASGLIAPVAGVVYAVNPDLVAAPDLANTEPYGRGWIITIRSEDVDAASLFTSEQYRDRISGK